MYKKERVLRGEPNANYREENVFSKINMQRIGPISLLNGVIIKLTLDAV